MKSVLVEDLAAKIISVADVTSKTGSPGGPTGWFLCGDSSIILIFTIFQFRIYPSLCWKPEDYNNLHKTKMFHRI